MFWGKTGIPGYEFSSPCMVQNDFRPFKYLPSKNYFKIFIFAGDQQQIFYFILF